MILDGRLRATFGRTRPPSKTAGGPDPFKGLAALKESLRRWWDLNQEFPGEGRTKESDGGLPRVGTSDSVRALCVTLLTGKPKWHSS
jgi:hypothetical protein